jgi:lipopolysaccharide biosynthesis glycosyltransferase
MIHLAVAFDEKYQTQFLVWLSSLVENAHQSSYTVHIIAPSFSDHNKERISKYLRTTQIVVTYYDIPSDWGKDFVLLSKWTQAVYYRLLFPLMVPTHVDKLLYVDVDTVITGDLSLLYSIDLNNYPVGAVYDNYVKEQSLIGVSEGEYFNSGMLLIDVSSWNNQKISEQAIDYLNRFPSRILFVDQCALNAVLKNNWLKISEQFNFLYSYVPACLSKKEMKLLVNELVIVHYTLQRPWHIQCENRLMYLYKEYFRKNPLLKSVKRYNTFSIGELIKYFKNRIVWFYYVHALLRWSWKKIKLLKPCLS